MQMRELTADETEAILREKEDEIGDKITSLLNYHIESLFDYATINARSYPRYEDGSGVVGKEELTPDNCPETLEEYLEETYSEQWTPTYISGFGRHYHTLIKELTDELRSSLNSFFDVGIEADWDTLCEWEQMVYTPEWSIASDKYLALRKAFVAEYREPEAEECDE